MSQSKTVTLTAEELDFVRLMIGVGLSETGYGDDPKDDALVTRVLAKLGQVGD